MGGREDVGIDLPSVLFLKLCSLRDIRAADAFPKQEQWESQLITVLMVELQAGHPKEKL